MKKWIKWTLGIFGVILVICLAALAWYWPTLSIISGTEGLTGETGTIPQAAMNALPPLSSGEADWDSWYGPDGQRQSRVSGIKTDWSAGLKKLWEVNYLCQGNESATWSAPVIKGNRLVICGRDTTDDLIFCLDPSDGSLLWKGSYRAKTISSHGAGPRATPYIDGENVYTFGRNGDLVCWRLYDGEKVWQKNVMDEGGEAPTWGHSSSPLVQGDLVLVQGGGNCRTIAFEKSSGQVVWKSGQGLPGYAPLKPMLMDAEPVVLAFHGKGLAAIDAADGSELWNIPWETSYNVNATTPLVINDHIFITSGYGTGSLLLQANRKQVKILWRSEAHSSIHSDPYLINGYLYGYSGDSFQNKGSFKCIDMENGQEIWSTNDMGWGTCTWVDGYLLTCDIKGNIYLTKPDPKKFIKISELRAALGDIRGPVWTTPVISNGKLYLRFKQILICYDMMS